MSNQPEGLELFRLRSIDEMSSIEGLQKRIWGYGRRGFDSIYPARALFALSESGGLVGGAVFRGNLVGFSAAWIGRDEASGEIFLQSQLLGVLPECRGLDIGYRLKLFQRDFAIRQKIESIRWTFDPLQAPNARLNLHKLGAISCQFIPNYYGNLRSSLVFGSSDRLWAEWPISSARVCRLLEKGVRPVIDPKIPRAILCESRSINGINLRVPVDLSFNVDSAESLVEVPSSLARISERDPLLLGQWRSTIRKVMEFYLGQGYIADDLVRLKYHHETLSFYHLKRPTR